MEPGNERFAIPYMYGANQVALTYEDAQDRHDHYVMWSGGCDSTMLLYELLRAYGPERVVAVSYIYPWLTAQKVQNEKDHRIAFMAAMKLRGLGDFRNLELKISQNNVIGDTVWVNQGAGLPQAVAWLLSVPIYASDDSYIYTGAIRNDDLTLRLESYHELFHGLTGVLRKNIKLREPYLYLTKANIIEKLIKEDLYDLTWFCENPSDGHITPCGRCVPCKTHHSALIELQQATTDPKVKAIVDSILMKYSPGHIGNNPGVNALQFQADCAHDNQTKAET